MFCSYWTHLGPTSLLESLGAEIVRILDLVTHSNNFDFLDKIQNLSEYILFKNVKFWTEAQNFLDYSVLNPKILHIHRNRSQHS